MFRDLGNFCPTKNSQQPKAFDGDSPGPIGKRTGNSVPAGCVGTEARPPPPTSHMHSHT